MNHPPVKRMSVIASAAQASLMLGHLQALQRPMGEPEKLPTAQELDQIDAALKMPRQHALNELSKKAAADLDRELRCALEERLGPLPEARDELAPILTGRLSCEKEPLEGEPEDGLSIDRYVLDDELLLVVHPPEVWEKEGRMGFDRKIERIRPGVRRG